MNTYKKPVLILVEVNSDELMAISSGQILDGNDRVPEKDLGGSGYTDGNQIEPQSKGWDDWE